MAPKWPRVAVSCDDEDGTCRRGAPAARYQLDVHYVAALADAGALACVLPHPRPRPHLPAPAAAARWTDAAAPLRPLAEAALAGCDGLLLTGGDFDVPPSWYDQPPHPALGRVSGARSAWEAALWQAAKARALPVLAICGGLQLINVVEGGSLHQDLALRPGTGVHVQTAIRREASHDVTLAPGSRLAEALGAARLGVNSTHHQVVAQLAPTLVATAQADDGVVEALTWRAGGQWLEAVQWHPEAMGDPRQQRLYAAFVAACRRGT